MPRSVLDQIDNAINSAAQNVTYQGSVGDINNINYNQQDLEEFNRVTTEQVKRTNTLIAALEKLSNLAKSNKTIFDKLFKEFGFKEDDLSNVDQVNFAFEKLSGTIQLLDSVFNTNSKYVNKLSQSLADLSSRQKDVSKDVNLLLNSNLAGQHQTTERIKVLTKESEALGRVKSALNTNNSALKSHLQSVADLNKILGMSQNELEELEVQLHKATNEFNNMGAVSDIFENMERGISSVTKKIEKYNEQLSENMISDRKGGTTIGLEKQYLEEYTSNEQLLNVKKEYMKVLKSMSPVEQALYRVKANNFDIDKADAAQIKEQIRSANNVKESNKEKINAVTGYQKALFALNDTRRNIDEKLEASTDMETIRLLTEKMDAINKLQKIYQKSSIESKKYVENMIVQGKTNLDNVDSIRELTGNLNQLNNVSKRSNSAFDDMIDQGTVSTMDLFTAKMREGEKEVGNFMSRFGGMPVGMAAVGAGFVMLTREMSKMFTELTNMSVQFSHFGRSLEVISAQSSTIFPGGREQLMIMRDQFNLTTRETMGLSQSLLGLRDTRVGIEDINIAMKSIRDTLGEIDVSAVEQLIKLYEQIPKEQIDLVVNAKGNMDEQMNALLNLSKTGNIGKVLELEAKGAFGKEVVGAVGTNLTNGEKVMIENQRHAVKLQEDFNMMMSGLAGRWMPYLGLMSNISTQIITMVGGVVGLLGMAKVISQQVKMTNSLLSNKTRTSYNTNQTQKSLKSSLQGSGNRTAPDRGMISNMYRDGNGNLMEPSQGNATIKSTVSKKTMPMGTARAGLVGGGVAATLVALPGLLSTLTDKTTRDEQRTKMNEVSDAETVVGDVFNSLGNVAKKLVNPLDAIYESGMNWGVVVSDVGSWISDSYHGKLKPAMTDYTDGYTELANEEIKRRRDSLELMQKSDSELKRINEGVYSQLNMFSNAVASAEIQNLAKIGGNAQTFGDAVTRGTKSISSAYKQNMVAIENERQRIIKDGSMDAATRRMQLEKIYKSELDVHAKFAQQLLSLVGMYEKIPEVYRNALEIKVNSLQLGYMFDGIAGSSESAGKLIESNLNMSLQNMGKSFTQFGKDIDSVNKAVSSVNAAPVKEEDVKKAILSIPEQVKRNMKQSGIDVNDYKNLSADELTKFSDERKNELDAKRKKVEMAQTAIGAAGAIEKNSFDPQDQENSFKDYHAYTRQYLKNFAIMEENMTDAERKQFGIIEGQGKEMLELGNKLRNKIKEGTVTDDDIVTYRSNVLLAMSKGKEVAQKMKVESLKILHEEIKQEQVLQQSLDIIKKFKSPLDISTQAWEAVNKTTQNMKVQAESFKAALEDIQKLVESSPESVKFQRLLNVTEASAGYMRAMGKSADYLNDYMNNYTGKLKAQQDAVNTANGIMNNIADASGKYVDYKSFGEKVSQVLDKAGSDGVDPKIIEQANTAKEAYLKILSKEMELEKQGGDVSSLYDEKIKAEKEYSSAMEKAAASAKGRNKEEVAASLKAMAATTTVLASIGGNMDKYRMKINEMSSKISSEAIAMFDNVVSKITEASNTLTVRVAKIAKELAGTQFESSRLKMDTTGMQKDTDKALSALDAEYASSIEAQKNMVALLEKEADKYSKEMMAAAGTKGEETARSALLAKQGMLDKSRAELLKKENEYLKEKDALIQKEREGRMEMLGYSQKELDIQRSMMEAVAAPLETLLSIESQTVQLARQRLNVELETYKKMEEHGASDVDLRKQGLRIREAELAVVKQQMGMQRSAMDKMLGGILSGFTKIGGFIGPSRVGRLGQGRVYERGDSKGGFAWATNGTEGGPGLQQRHARAMMTGGGYGNLGGSGNINPQRAGTSGKFNFDQKNLAKVESQKPTGTSNVMDRTAKSMGGQVGEPNTVAEQLTTDTKNIVLDGANASEKTVSGVTKIYEVLLNIEKLMNGTVIGLELVEDAVEQNGPLMNKEEKKKQKEIDSSIVKTINKAVDLDTLQKRVEANPVMEISKEQSTHTKLVRANTDALEKVEKEPIINKKRSKSIDNRKKRKVSYEEYDELIDLQEQYAEYEKNKEKNSIVQGKGEIKYDTKNLVAGNKGNVYDLSNQEENKKYSEEKIQDYENKKKKHEADVIIAKRESEADRKFFIKQRGYESKLQDSVANSNGDISAFSGGKKGLSNFTYKGFKDKGLGGGGMFEGKSASQSLASTGLTGGFDMYGAHTTRQVQKSDGLRVAKQARKTAEDYDKIRKEEMDEFKKYGTVRVAQRKQSQTKQEQVVTGDGQQQKPKPEPTKQVVGVDKQKQSDNALDKQSLKGRVDKNTQQGATAAARGTGIDGMGKTAKVGQLTTIRLEVVFNPEIFNNQVMKVVLNTTNASNIVNRATSAVS